MDGLFKSKISNISLLAITLVLCVNMGGGRHSENVMGEEPPFFVLKDGLLSFSGTITDAGKENPAERICFFDPTDEDCRSGGKPAGVTYLKVFEKDSDLRSKIDLHSIRELRVISQDSASRLYISERHHTGLTKNRIFVTMQITSVKTSEQIEYLIDPDISVGFINPKTSAKVNVFLRKIDSIKIDHPEIKDNIAEKSSYAKASEDKEEKALESILFGR